MNQILLLDEPTAGMDPVSRHQVWSLLKSRRAGRVTVLSTHYMDEADILAGTSIIFTFLQSVIYASISHTSVRHTDRKAVISQGQLKCVGSSLYLKTKCGVGYHLRLVLRKVQKLLYIYIYIYFLPVTHCCCYINTVIPNLL